MSKPHPEETRLAGLVEALHARLDELLGRVAALESALGAPAPTPAAPPVEAPPPEPPPLDEATLYAIASAVAAYLGKKPHIRQIRLLGTPSWAQQGRVTIHASHALSVARD
jgi:methylmalonyl-CoA carboxyltransferase large subunit